MKLLNLGNETFARKQASSESIKNTRGGGRTTTYCTQDNDPFKDVLSTFLAEALSTSVCLDLEYTERKDVPPLISQIKGSSPFHLPPLLSNTNASHPHDWPTVLASGRRLRKENGVGTFSLRPKEDTEQDLGDAKMAASVMACCGRLPAFKVLSQQAWGLRSMPSVYVCTKPGDSKKGFPKAAKPSPETAQETYDTSTYKNLQHHEYQPFTFVDFDVLLSKFRLPQPSSGRLSPRH